MGPYYKYMDCPEDFLKFEDIVGDYYVCSDDYLDEVWARIPGHSDYYISNYGRAYSAKTDTFLKPKRLDRKGHVGFCLSEGKGHVEYRYLHRLMAEAFIWNPDNLPVVRHLNDDPSKYHLISGSKIDGLHWNSYFFESFFSIFIGQYTCSSVSHAIIPVISLCSPSEIIKVIVHRMSEAARELGLQQANVWKVLNGQRPATGGYYFEYLEKDGDTDARDY